MTMTHAMSRRSVLKTGLSIAALAGLPGVAVAAPKQGGVLNIGVSAEMNYNMLCFAMTGDTKDYIYAQPVYESLFRPNAKGTVDPWLLASADADPDALTYVFKVRPGITFSDGTPFDAAAVKWNLDHYLKVGSKRIALLGSIKSVDRVDDMTVKLTLSAWSSIIPTALSRECGYMFSPTHYEKNGDAYCQEHPVGTGPFVLQSWKRGVNKVFVRNDTYWGGRPPLDGVTYTVYNDPVVAQAALISGEIDAFAGMAMTGYKPLQAAGFEVVNEPLMDHSSLLVFNSVNAGNDDPTGNVLVRRAISHAINRAALVKAAYLGTAEVSSQFGIGTHYLNPKLQGYAYDPAKAKALLAEAGYPNGFATQILTSSEPPNKQVIEIIQADLAKVGITAKIQLLAGAAANQAANGWGSGMWYHTSSVYVSVPMQMASMFTQGLTGGVLGLTTMLRPDDVHAALIRSVTARSDAEAVAAVGEANRLMIDTYATYVPIAEYCVPYILSKRVKDSGIGATFYSIADLGKAWLDG
jgi:peptide/nickel transport system substrate-binding protein